MFFTFKYFLWLSFKSVLYSLLFQSPPSITLSKLMTFIFNLCLISPISEIIRSSVLLFIELSAFAHGALLPQIFVIFTLNSYILDFYFVGILWDRFQKEFSWDSFRCTGSLATQTFNRNYQLEVMKLGCRLAENVMNSQWKFFLPILRRLKYMGNREKIFISLTFRM